jgi:uncharacterized membrane protein
MTILSFGTNRNGDRSGGRGAEPPEGLAKALGWASVGLGLPQLLAPSAVDRLAGVGDGRKQQTLTRLVGGRELLHAAALLVPRTRTQWLWTRVAGDAMDLTVLGRALLHHDRGGRARTVAATAAVAGIAVVDVYAAVTAARTSSGGSPVITGTTTVRKDPADVYAYWRAMDHFPAFMAHVESVQMKTSTSSHWKVAGPLGRTVEWDAEIVEDLPGKRLSWKSVAGADVDNEGTVTFAPAPGDRGTEIHVSLCYAMPGGKLGEVIARFQGEDPRQQLDDDLRRFKQVMETGAIVRSDGAPGGKRSRREFPQRPAQPLTAAEAAEVLA